MSLGSKLSRASNFASGACLIHCISFPVLVGILPAIGLSFLLTGRTEKIIIWAAISLSASGMCWGYRTHRKLGYLALTLFLVLSAALYFYMAMGSRQHLFFMLLGGVVLATGNVANRKLCAQCEHCKEHSHDKKPA
jgi:hypothetical protein